VDLQAETGLNAIIVGDINTPLSSIGHPENNDNKETSELNTTIDQIDFTDSYRIFHPACEQSYYSQQSMEHSLKYIIFQNIKQA
jgi:hypothetical protein